MITDYSYGTKSLVSTCKENLAATGTQTYLKNNKLPDILEIRVI